MWFWLTKKAIPSKNLTEKEDIMKKYLLLFHIVHKHAPYEFKCIPTEAESAEQLSQNACTTAKEIGEGLYKGSDVVLQQIVQF
jgi:hypothetical protein